MVLEHRCYLLIGVLLGIFAAVNAANIPVTPFTIKAENNDEINYRLPNNIVPKHYEITLKVDVDNFKFYGFCTIDIDVKSETDTIVLHAWDLEIKETLVQLLDVQNIRIAIKEQKHDAEPQFYNIILENNLPVGNYRLVFNSFNGVIHDDNFGLYRASYEDKENVRRWMATTQFESTGARRVFPCFDEPALKATISLKIIAPKIYTTVVANTPIESNGNFSEIYDYNQFETSQPMSTYLIAFTVSDYAQSEVKFSGRTEHSVYARKDAIEENLADYALDTSIQILDEMERYTTIAYNFGKLDQIAIPDKYYKWGAMENWGLVTYKERYLLFDEKTSTSREKENILTIIAHEYAHQWFGNLVSPDWWKYIWLNEGFATFFEMDLANKVDASMDLANQFVIFDVHNALEYDSTPNTRPMTHDAQKPADIDLLFDRIAYQKSGSVIRMMESFLTEEVLRRGLVKYLKDKAYQNAVSADLWKSIQAILDDSVSPRVELPRRIAEIMEPWETQAGYPLITVTRNYQLGTVNFKQTRFLEERTNDTSEETWIIPITLTTKSDPNFDITHPKYWMSTPEFDTPILDYQPPESWIIINNKQTGYYRVQYDLTNWNLITDYLNNDDSSIIDVRNKAQLIDDSFTLAKYGLLSYEIPLNLIKYLALEHNYIPIYTFLKHLKFLDKYLAYTTEYEIFKKFIVSLLETTYNQLGDDISTNDSHTDRYLRADVINWLCKYGHSNCKENMAEKLKTWTVQTPDMQSPVYCSGYQDNYDWLWLSSELKIEKSNTRKERLLNALSCVDKSELLEKYVLNLMKGSIENVDKSDIMFALRAIYTRGHIQAEALLKILKENISSLTDWFDYKEISIIFKGVAEYLTTEDHLNELNDFVNNHVINVNDAELNSILLDTISILEKNDDWAKTNLPFITEWLKATEPPPVTTTEDTTTTELPTTTQETTTAGVTKTVLNSGLLVWLVFIIYF